MKLSVKQIENVAIDLIEKHPNGIRYSELAGAISAESPETPRNTIQGSIWNLETKFPDKIAKPSRGVFKPISVSGNVPELEMIEAAEPRISEDKFYEPFANWLKNELGEVTRVHPLGGAGLKAKWGTPDVAGVYRPGAADLIKFPTEIVTAEIKTDPRQPIVAFGQAIAYRLFSSKTYIVMPKSINPVDYDRLEALCVLFGLGLVLFDLNTERPAFEIRVRAQRFSPDMFYVNEFAKSLHNHDAEVFESLFG